MTLRPFVLGIYYFAVLSSLQAQVHSQIVDAPRLCRDEATDINVIFAIRYSFSNKASSPVQIKLGNYKNVGFTLFTEDLPEKHSVLVQRSSPDFVVAPTSSLHTVMPGRYIKWTTEVTILMRDWDQSDLMPKSGRYLLLPSLDIKVINKPTSEASELTKANSLPIYLPSSQQKVPPCKK